MADDSQRGPRAPLTPPGEASPPHDVPSRAGPIHNTHPGAERRVDAGGAEPREEDLGRRSFAGENWAADERQQRLERGAGYGAGSSANRDARHPTDEDVDTRGLERDGNGEPLGGMTPEDDLD